MTAGEAKALVERIRLNWSTFDTPRESWTEYLRLLADVEAVVVSAAVDRYAKRDENRRFPPTPGVLWHYADWERKEAEAAGQIDIRKHNAREQSWAEGSIRAPVNTLMEMGEVERAQRVSAGLEPPPTREELERE